MSNHLAIAQIVTGLAEYYDKPLSPSQLSMYVEDLLGVEPKLLIEAVAKYRNDPKNDRFPLPAKLKAAAMPETNPEHEALEAVARIVSAVSNIGPYRVEDAKAHIGPLGWAVVQAEGGFENVCQVLNEDNIGILKAQWRNLAIAKQSRSAAGFDHAPGLPAPKGELNRLGFSNLLKQLPQPELGHE